MRDTLSELQAILALLNATPADLVQLQYDQLCREEAEKLKEEDDDRRRPEST